MVFYFTGTGNSLYIAKELDAQAISIPRVIRNETLTYKADKIGVVCPIYGHEMPRMVKEFLRKAELYSDYLYIILTYGEMHGGAAEIAREYLASVGKKADYINTIKMVDNFLPNFDMTEQVKKDKQVEKHLAEIKADVENRRAAVQKARVKDKAVHKMYIGFVNNQPETMWASYRVTDECVGCGICTRVCPGGCIRLENQKAVHSMDGCQACMACVHACPKTAIKMNMKEPNPDARYRNEHIELKEIIAANNQTDN